MLQGRSPPSLALAAALIYATLGALWIAGSDEFVALLARDAGQLSRLQSLKGWAYVGITAVLAYGLVRALLGRDARLRAQAGRMAAILEHAPVGIALLDVDGRCSQASPALYALLGAEPDSLTGSDFRQRLELTPEQWLAAFVEPQWLHRKLGERTQTLRLSLSSVDQSVAADSDAGAAVIVLTLQDVTHERREAERERLAAVAFESWQPTLIADPDGRILRINRANLALTGFSAEEVIGRNPRIFGSGQQDACFYQQMWEALARDGYWEGELINRRRDGSFFPQWESITAVRDADGRTTHYVAHAIDLSERREIERTLHRLENHDRLTGLSNRNHLLQQLGAAEAQSAGLALLLLDIDRFRSLNSALGLARGDAVLREVAGLLAKIQPRSQ